MNLFINPASILLTGGFRGGISFPIDKKISIGAEYFSIEMTQGALKASSSGLSLLGQYNFSGLFKDSYYSNIHIGYNTINVENTLFLSEYEAPTTVISFIYGKQWVWDNSFNIKFGLGFQNITIGSIELKKGQGTQEIPSQYKGTLLDGELTLGFFL